VSEILDYAVEVEVFNSADFMQEIMSPTFIILASCVAVATLIVILLIGLICKKICHSKTGYSVPTSQVKKLIFKYQLILLYNGYDK
jgi:hypothetical protein